MIVLNPELLKRYRGIPCEWCGLRAATEAHHYFSKGMGGGSQVDMPWNLIGLCLYCHRDVHNGSIIRKSVLLYISLREGTTPEWITGEYHRISRLPKDASFPVPENPGRGLPPQVQFARAFPRPDIVEVDEREKPPRRAPDAGG